MLDVEFARLGGRVVAFFIDEDEKRITEAVDFLPGTLERAGRLRLTNACNLDVHFELWEINALG